MTFRKLLKTHFGEYLVHFSEQYFQISGKTCYHGIDVTNTTSPNFFFVHGSLRCKNKQCTV